MKVHAKKRGSYYIVYQDAGTFLPAVLAGPEDEPLGAVGLVPCTKTELEQQFPGAEFVIHEVETAPQPVNVRSKKSKAAGKAAVEQFEASLTAEEKQSLNKASAPPSTGGQDVIDAYAEGFNNASKPKVTDAKGLDMAALAGLVGAFVPKTKPAGGERAKAEEFLKRIEFAILYASEDNQVTLKTQYSVIKELIEEVFG